MFLITWATSEGTNRAQVRGSFRIEADTREQAVKRAECMARAMTGAMNIQIVECRESAVVRS